MKYKECPLKRLLLSGRVVRSFEIQVANATNVQKNGSAEENSSSDSQLRQTLMVHTRTLVESPGPSADHGYTERK